MDSSPSAWFESWFDSPYYHLLYGDRDEKEADAFIGRLVEFLHPAPGARALDLACGKGRHAIALHRHGLDVTGIDLSPKSIEAAKQLETDGLSFSVHDMRHTLTVNYFDLVFNLFTSFGYFTSEHDNDSVMKAVRSALKRNGRFVIDFFNAELVAAQVTKEPSCVVEKGGIAFCWEKKIEEGRVVKTITFTDKGRPFEFTERVQLLTLDDFRRLLGPYFSIENTFGDYNLGTFDPRKSPRLILIARKR